MDHKKDLKSNIKGVSITTYKSLKLINQTIISQKALKINGKNELQIDGRFGDDGSDGECLGRCVGRVG